MKKVFAKTLAFLALFGMISGSAMAADPIDVYKDDNKITVKVSTLEESEETSLLVTKGTATIAEAFADNAAGKINNILYLIFLFVHGKAFDHIHTIFFAGIREKLQKCADL